MTRHPMLTIGQLIAAWNDQPRTTPISRDKAREKASREWAAAIAALPTLLEEIGSSLESGRSTIISAPGSVLHPQDFPGLETVVLTPRLATPMRQLPGSCQPEQPRAIGNACGRRPIAAATVEIDLVREPFCIALTPEFSLVMALTQQEEGAAFHFSFAPEVVAAACEHLRSHLVALPAHPEPVTPDYRLVTRFSRLLLDCLPEAPTERCTQAIAPEREATPPVEVHPEVELLQALTHEIRTPLTTIRMLVRLLLKRQDLAPQVSDRLGQIDRECSQQIERMELIFRATELEACQPQPKGMQLAPVPLEQIFAQSIPNWQRCAQRHNVTLDALLPETLPSVVSDPAMLDRVLTGLMENYTSNLPIGARVTVRVDTVGDRLKLQLQARKPATVASTPSKQASQPAPLKIGQVLSLQPETGCLSLNLEVTKNLLEALGAKLKVCQRPQEGEVMTVFLPLGTTWRNLS